MKYLFYIILFLYTGISFTGCVKEDTSDCPPGEIVVNPEDRVLYFKTIPSKYTFEEKLENLQLYAYADDVNPIVSFFNQLDKRQLAAYNYTLPWNSWIDTKHYNYHVMGILNYNEHYNFINTNTLRDFQTHIQPTFDEIVSHEISDVFVGYFDFNTRTKTIQGDTLYLEKLTNHVHVTIEFNGFELEVGSELLTRISGNNARYDYRNNCLEECFMHYQPYNEEYIIDRSNFTFSITTGKLYIGDDLELYIELYDQDDNLEDVESFNLVGYISTLQDSNGNYLYNTNAKLREEDEFYIHIVIDENFDIMEIIINDWYVVDPGGTDL